MVKGGGGVGPIGLGVFILAFWLLLNEFLLLILLAIGNIPKELGEGAIGLGGFTWAVLLLFKFLLL
jgi:hypothetical protein